MGSRRRRRLATSTVPDLEETYHPEISPPRAVHHERQGEPSVACSVFRFLKHDQYLTRNRFV
jgi:hypothetical protein